MPHEFQISGVFFPPMLIAGFIGVVAAVFTVRALNRFRLARFFYAPTLVQLCLAILYTLLVNSFLYRF
jgi:hypothetical protein